MKRRSRPALSYNCRRADNYACPGNGSPHSEDIPSGRGRPPGELFRSQLGTHAGCSSRCAPPEESLWLHARDSVPRATVVRRARDPRLSPHPAVRVARVLQQGPERLPHGYRLRRRQRNRGTRSSGARGLRAHVPADLAHCPRDRTPR